MRSKKEKERANCSRVNAETFFFLFFLSACPLSLFLSSAPLTLKQNILNSSEVGSSSGCSVVLCCCCWWLCWWEWCRGEEEEEEEAWRESFFRSKKR